MRDLDPSFIAAIASGSVKITELFTIELATGDIYRYTTHDQNLTWDAASNTYYSTWPISRDAAQLGIDSGADSVQIALANIIGDLATKIKKNMLDGATLTIKRIRWNDTYAADKEITIFVGSISVTYDRKEATFEVIPQEESLAIKFPPHTYQEPCNHTLFDERCELTKSDYEYSGTATGGSATTLIDTTRGSVYKVDFDGGDSSNPIEIGDSIEGQTGLGTAKIVNIVYLTATTGTIWYVEQSGAQFIDDEEIQNAGADSIIVNGMPAADTALYQKGELEMTSGDNAGLKVEVLSDSANTITIFGSFPYAVESGDTYKLYPGCDYKAETCDNTFNNSDNFSGFLHTPQYEETAM